MQQYCHLHNNIIIPKQPPSSPMDRLVNSDVTELHLIFTIGTKPTTTFRLTNLMHTMPVAVSLTTTNPSIFTFTQPSSIIAPLAAASFTLTTSKPLDQPPLSTPSDVVHVRSTMLPTGKASPEELRRLFSKPGPHIFKDATIPISFVGFRVIEFLITSKTLENMFMVPKAIMWCDESEVTSLLGPAVVTGSGYVVEQLLDAGAVASGSVVSLAVKAGDVDIVRVLVESGVVVDHERDRLLHDAAGANRVDIMEVLCEFLDLDVNLVDSDGKTPVHVAASCGYVEVLEFLIGLGCDTDVADRNGWTAVHCAAASGHFEAVDLLLNSCNYVKYAVDNEGKTAFDLAVENGHTGLYDMLRLGDDLHRAARKGDVGEMKRCLLQGAKVNGRDQNGWTPLHKTAFKGHIDGVQLLLNHGGLVGLVDGSGYTALHRAVEAGHTKVAMMLIAHGAKASMKSLAVPFDFDSLRNHSPLRGKIERA